MPLSLGLSPEEGRGEALKGRGEKRRGGERLGELGKELVPGFVPGGGMEMARDRRGVGGGPAASGGPGSPPSSHFMLVIQGRGLTSLGSTHRL